MTHRIPAPTGASEYWAEVDEANAQTAHNWLTLPNELRRYADADPESRGTPTDVLGWVRRAEAIRLKYWRPFLEHLQAGRIRADAFVSRDRDEVCLLPAFWREIDVECLDAMVGEVESNGIVFADIRIAPFEIDELRSESTPVAIAAAYLEPETTEAVSTVENGSALDEAGNHVESGRGQSTVPKNKGGRPAYEFWPRAQEKLKKWGMEQAKKKGSVPIQARFAEQLADIIGSIDKPKGVNPVGSTIRRYAKAAREEVVNEFEGL